MRTRLAHVPKKKEKIICYIMRTLFESVFFFLRDPSQICIFGRGLRTAGQSLPGSCPRLRGSAAQRGRITNGGTTAFTHNSKIPTSRCATGLLSVDSECKADTHTHTHDLVRKLFQKAEFLRWWPRNKPRIGSTDQSKRKENFQEVETPREIYLSPR